MIGTVFRFVLGLFLFVTALPVLFGNMERSMAESRQRIIENGTVTTGRIEERIEHIVGAKVGRGVGVGAYYTIRYSFTTKDGKKYWDSVDVSRAQAMAAHDGQKIRVKYHAKTPSISSAIDYKPYFKGDASSEKQDARMMKFVSLCFLLIGAALLWFNGGRSLARFAHTASGAEGRQNARATNAARIDRVTSGPAKFGGK